jgi:hypothetical protein
MGANVNSPIYAAGASAVSTVFFFLTGTARRAVFEPADAARILRFTRSTEVLCFLLTRFCFLFMDGLKFSYIFRSGTRSTKELAKISSE